MKKCFLWLALAAATVCRAVNPVPYTEGVSFSFRISGVGNGIFTIYDETGGTSVGHTTYNATTESVIGIAQLRPGKKYDVNFQASGPSEYWLSYTAPEGYRLYIDNRPSDLSYANTGGGWYSHDYTIELVPISHVAQADFGQFTGVQLGKSVSWGIGLGNLSTGRSAGCIFFKEYDLTNSPSARERLYYSEPGSYGEAWSIRDGDSNRRLRQVCVPQGLVDLLDDGNGGYWIRFFLWSQAEGSPGNPYIIYGSPWKTIHVESPAASQLRIIETEGTSVRVSLVDAPSISSGTYNWKLREGGPSSNWLRTTTHASIPSTTAPVQATGGTITTSGSYTIHTFTNSGTFTVPAGLSAVAFDTLLVGGGGGGGGTGVNGGGGGGGGGVVTRNGFTLSATAYTVTVGGGGSAGSTGGNGGNTTFAGMTAFGGGGGGTSWSLGSNGGSGGGSGRDMGSSSTSSSTQTSNGGGTGYGNAGGASPYGSWGDAGGGGGAGAAGQPGQQTYPDRSATPGGGHGGIGIASTISGTSVYYGGGGGGCSEWGDGGIGGLGGGGNGNGYSSGPGAGAANTGGGGGGGQNGGGYNVAAQPGGSGIVIVRYPTQNASYRDVTVEVRTGDESGQVISKSKFRYKNVGGWGEEVIEIYAYPTATTADSDALKTTFEYHTNSNAPGNYRRVKWVKQPSGGWSAQSYFDDWDRRGQLQYEFFPWQSAPATPALAPTDGRVVSYTYGPDWTGRYTRPTLREERIKEGSSMVQTGKAAWSYSDITGSGWPRIATTTSLFSQTGTAVTQQSEAYRADAGWNEALTPTYAKQPDLSQTSYSSSGGHWNGSNFSTTAGIGWWRTLMVHGSHSSGESVSSWGGQSFPTIYAVPYKSTMDAVVLYCGQPIRTETYVYVGSGNFELMTYENLIYYDQRRLKERVANNGATTTTIYENGLLQSATMPDGTETHFTYDALWRVYTSTKKGISAADSYAAQNDITTTNTYDGANHVVETLTSAGGLSLTSKMKYDTAGRLEKSTAPGGYETKYEYPEPRKTKITFPNQGTKEINAHLDGQVNSVTGTGIVSENYEYSIDPANGRRVVKLTTGGNSAQWVKTYSDWLGRKSEMSAPRGDGSTASDAWSYNAYGQLSKASSPGRAPTLYVYNTLGALVREGVDVSGNDVLDEGSNDRINDNDYYYFYYQSGWYLEKTSRTFTTSGSPTSKQISKENWQLSNLPAGIFSVSYNYDVSDNAVVTVQQVDRASKLVTNIVAYPDSSVSARQIVRNGLVVSSRSKTNITTTFTYDALGRQTAAIDPRIGATKTVYVAGTNQVDKFYDAYAAARLPSADAPTATYHYDAAGRVDRVSDSFGKKAFTAYTLRDEVYRQWGDSAAPVEYSYDPQGRRETMKTFRGGTGWTQADWPGTGANLASSPGTADTTTWVFQPATGFLASKVDADGKSVDYTYTQAGQIYTRKWARAVSDVNSDRVTATYAYFATGEISGASYNDGVTTGLTYTYNRLGAIGSVADITGTRSFTYNLSGNLQVNSEILPSGFYGNRRVSRGYSASGPAGRYNRLSIGTDSNSYAEYDMSYGYDGFGRLNSAYVFNYTYEPNSDLVASTTYSPWNYTHSYEYDEKRNAVRVSATSIAGVSQPKSRFEVVRDDLGRIVRSVRTGELFERYGASANQGIDALFTYDDLSQLKTEVVKLTGTTTEVPGRNDEYFYDSFGNRTNVKRARALGAAGGIVENDYNTSSYPINSLNQIKARTVPDRYDLSGLSSASAVSVREGTTDYATVASGNYFFRGHPLRSTTDALQYKDLAIMTPGVGSGSQNTSGFLPASPELFDYDRDGNLTRDGRWVYRYDAENRLVSMFTRGAPEEYAAVRTAPENQAVWNSGLPRQKITFAYDYLGRRVRKTLHNWNSAGTGSWTVASGGDLKFLYDGWNCLLELDAASLEKVTGFVWGLDLSGGLQGAGGVGGLLYTYNYALQVALVPCYDHNGNVWGLITPTAKTFGGTSYPAGSLVAAYEFDAFGRTLFEGGPCSSVNSVRYSTKYTDLETGLAYYGLRYYSPSLGRFINRDPSEEQGGLNLFAFCLNNGINRWDYLGMDSKEADGGGEYGFAAGAGGPPRSVSSSSTSIDAANERSADHMTVVMTFSDGTVRAVSLREFASFNPNTPISSFNSIGTVIASPTIPVAAPTAIDLRTPQQKAADDSIARESVVSRGAAGQLAFGPLDPKVVQLEPFLVTADRIHTALDIIGIFDPTGISDGANALLYADRKDWGNAFYSAASLVPLGDIAKLKKYGNALEKTAGKWLSPKGYLSEVKGELYAKIKSTLRNLEQGQHGVIDKRVGNQLIQHANDLEKQHALPEIVDQLRTEGQRLIDKGGSISHKN